MKDVSKENEEENEDSSPSWNPITNPHPELLRQVGASSAGGSQVGEGSSSSSSESDGKGVQIMLQSPPQKLSKNFLDAAKSTKNTASGGTTGGTNKRSIDDMKNARKHSNYMGALPSSSVSPTKDHPASKKQKTTKKESSKKEEKEDLNPTRYEIASDALTVVSTTVPPGRRSRGSKIGTFTIIFNHLKHFFLTAFFLSSF
jgi:hypothetical protein